MFCSAVLLFVENTCQEKSCWKHEKRSYCFILLLFPGIKEQNRCFSAVLLFFIFWGSSRRAGFFEQEEQEDIGGVLCFRSRSKKKKQRTVLFSLGILRVKEDGVFQNKTNTKTAGSGSSAKETTERFFSPQEKESSTIAEQHLLLDKKRSRTTANI